MPNRLKKWLPIIVRISLTKRYVRIFSHFVFLSMGIPYCGKAHAACGMYTQLSMYVESKITTFVPQVPQFVISHWLPVWIFCNKNPLHYAND